VYVPRWNWDSPKRVCPSPRNQRGGGAHSPAGEGLGESQFRRLEKKLSTLHTLWFTVSFDVTDSLRGCVIHRNSLTHTNQYCRKPPLLCLKYVLLFNMLARLYSQDRQASDEWGRGREEGGEGMGRGRGRGGGRELHASIPEVSARVATS
jgi:hypothetical protein